jgi:hypothetical protein
MTTEPEPLVVPEPTTTGVGPVLRKVTVAPAIGASVSSVRVAVNGAGRPALPDVGAPRVRVVGRGSAAAGPTGTTRAVARSASSARIRPSEVLGKYTLPPSGRSDASGRRIDIRLREAIAVF